MHGAGLQGGWVVCNYRHTKDHRGLMVKEIVVAFGVISTRIQVNLIFLASIQINLIFSTHLAKSIF